MKCEHDDCFTCPYPDCIDGTGTYENKERKKRTAEERREYQRRYYQEHKTKMRAQNKASKARRRSMRRNNIDNKDIMEPKPCPFCGSTNIKIDKCTLRVRCGNCFATSGLISKFVKDGKKDFEAALIAWNTRSEDAEND